MAIARTKSKISRRYRAHVVAIVAVLLVAAALAALSAYAEGRDPTDADAVALRVNGEPVSAREWRQAVLRHRATVYAELQAQSPGTGQDEFWRTKIGEETPLERLHRVALAELVRAKAQRQLAVREGLLADSSYEAFLTEWETENERRREAVRRGEVIFGPERYDEAAYYDAKQGELADELQQKLYPAADATEERIAAYYEEHKTTLFRRTPIVELRQLVFPYGENGATREQAEAWAAGVHEALEAGESRDAARERLTSPSGEAFAVETTKLDEAFLRDEGMRWRQLAALGLKMEKGDVGEPFEENGAYRILVCIGVEPRGSYPLEDVKDGIRGEWGRLQYEEYLDRLAGEANVEIEREAFDRVDGT
ncbi:peptidyl-prolyl cis-trans isomerase [Cohnella sp. GCM10027633]|uniref:peptidylprolyl isomerase n=1 Tax=unclassified Cohnella TaxID=2636738 RepID=UPI0036433D7F